MNTKLIRTFGLLVFCGYAAFSQESYSLKKALQTARSNNPDLKTEFYNQSMAQADIITAGLRPNPQLNNQTLQLLDQGKFAPGYGWTSFHNRQDWWQMTKHFQQPGARRQKIDLAQKTLEQTQKQYVETEREVLNAVALKWLDVWYAQQNFRMVQRARSIMDSLLYINKLRYEKQVITQSDLFRTQVLADQYDLQIKSSQQTYNNELKNLRYVTGAVADVALDTAAEFLISIPPAADSLLAQALRQRADLQVLNSAMDVAEANIALQHTLRLPTGDIGFICNPQNAIPYFGLYATIELPVFERNQGERKKSVFAKDQISQNIVATKQQTQTEVETAYGTFITQQQNVESYKQILKQSEQIRESVKYAYLKGGTTIIDFLEAQRGWLDTQQQYTDAVFEYRKAYIQLLFATGTINQLAQ